jgi:hypothetical protein
VNSSGILSHGAWGFQPGKQVPLHGGYLFPVAQAATDTAKLADDSGDLLVSACGPNAGDFLRRAYCYQEPPEPNSKS